MKKIIFFWGLAIVFCLTACGGGYIRWKNQKADDAISRAIYEEFGDDIYYLGKDDNPRNDLCYEYLVRTEDAGLITKLVTTVNEVIEQEKITEKVSISCGAEIPGGLTWIVVFSNFSDYEDTIAEYQGLQRMTLIGDRHALVGEDYFYDDPSLYINIPNIKSILIYEKMKGKAEAQGIDWYACYPELENFEVYIPEN